MFPLTELLRSQIDLASIADLDSVLVRTHQNESWSKVTVDDKVKTLLFTNLGWGFRDGRDIGDTYQALASTVLTIGEVREEVDIHDYLEQRGLFVSEDMEPEHSDINAHSKSS